MLRIVHVVCQRRRQLGDKGLLVRTLRNFYGSGQSTAPVADYSCNPY